MNDPHQTVDLGRQEAPPVPTDGTPQPPVPTDGTPQPPVPTDGTPQPQQIGRYLTERVLGKGGFGLVYLAHDEQLTRQVAIKVPHARLVAQTANAEAYLTEARTVANLDHPNIVPVFDVGSTEQFPCYVVSKYIDGIDLASRLKQSPLSLHEAVQLVATVGEGLHHAHRQGLVHRDIKPANILLDKSGKPFVADFGLALREQDLGKGPRFAGTPAYMSPEQARGEGHRVDGRSDIFSLGVVLYELLTGRRPFKADSQAELLEQISSVDARPPRQVDDTIPRELERICLKALAKRASERYTTAKDMADDLRHFLAEASVAEKSRPTIAGGNLAVVPSPIPTPSDQQAVKIVPKGLRSFDAGDADFFLELLPGPRDRDGLPDSIRFWKNRVEETDPDKTFSVGLIYGPSGCGKSSLVRAGLLPRLGNHVIPIYIEATAAETEVRLLKGLRKHCPSLPVDLALADTLAALRRGGGKKVLLVLDQVEQWLHAKRGEDNSELVKALRQCDGERVQAIVMVRDDFWMAVTRLMQTLEVGLVPNQNIAAVDLFDLRHAKKVLLAFGRAFGSLPERDLTKDQASFLEQAVAGLGQEGKVISVRLAVFAEMVKGKPWTSATLQEVGGTEGVGFTFLEDTFSARTAQPQYRLHQKAAQAVLKSLLPEAGTDIKGHMRSQQELMEASGYGSRPRDLEELLRILDSELRLITPTDPEGVEGERLSQLPSGGKYYQLTHDYLVPSLRDWLTRKQKETRRGRAELLLADRASVWHPRPENRQLPSLWQWCSIRWLTYRENWTSPQRKMMRQARWYHSVRGLTVAVCLILLGWGGYAVHGTLKAHALQERLLDANTNEVPTIVQDMAPYRRWLDSLLREAYQEAKAKQELRKQLHASLALLPVDSAQVEYLYERLLGAAPSEVPVIRDALASHKDDLLDQLWAVAEASEKGKESQRIRAAAALAKYDPESERWAKVQEAVANDLVTVPAVYLAAWLESFRPVRAKLLTPLAAIFRAVGRRDAERSLATDILADYAADQPQFLADLLMDADEKQFAVIYPKFKEQGEEGSPVLTGEIDKKLPFDLPSSDERREKLAKRKANAAVALLKMGQPAKVWPLLKQSPDPRVRSYLIHRFGPMGADAEDIAKRLHEEQDVTIRRALILSLGPEEFGKDAWNPEEKKLLVKQLKGMFSTEADPGLHAAAEWLLRQWQEETWLQQTNEGWAKDKEQREKRLDGIKQMLVKGKDKTPPQWHVNGQGQTMVVIPGPVKFQMGSPTTEAARQDYEPQHKKLISRSFAIAAKSVTVEQYGQFNKRHDIPQKYTRTADLPVVGISWYMAAEYCNWLSKKEGLAECYETDAKGQVTKLKAKYLSLSGYRLPTEAEMEYATRAGASTSRYYGETEALLPKYGWYLRNAPDKTWPVGSLKPNDLGFFDMQGNVYCWCQERYRAYPQGQGERPEEDEEDTILSIDKQTFRVLRGGSFGVQALNVRSACRASTVPMGQSYGSGFRPARTVP